MIVECSGCGNSLRIKAPKGLARFVCPNCGKNLRVKVPAVKSKKPQPSQPQPPQPQPSQPQPLQPAPNPKPPLQPPASAPIAPTLQPAAPSAYGVGAYPSAAHPAQKRNRPKRKKKWRLIGGILACVTLLSLLVAVGVGAFFLFKKTDLHALNTNVLSSLNPLADTPDSITREYVATADEFIAIVDSIKDKDSASRAVKKLDGLNETCLDISARAILLGPLTDEQWRSVGSISQRKIPDKKQQVKNALERMRARNVRSDDLAAAFVDFHFASFALNSAMETAWKTIPDPTNELQELQRERIRVYRELWQSVARQYGKSDANALTAAYERATDRIAVLAQRKRKLGNVERLEPFTGSPYTHIEARFSMAISRALRDCLEKSRTEQSESLAAAVQRFNDTEYDFGAAGTKHDPTKTAEDFEADRLAENAARRERMLKSRQRAQAMAMSPEKFIAKHGGKNVVTVVVMNLDTAAGHGISKRLRASVASGAIMWNVTDEKTTFLMVYDGEVTNVSDAIDWGKVTSTSVANRTIQVRAD